MVAIEFDEGGHTFWVQGLGGTVLRIKTTGRFLVDRCNMNPVSHADININGDVTVCVSDRDSGDVVDAHVEQLLGVGPATPSTS